MMMESDDEEDVGQPQQVNNAGSEMKIVPQAEHDFVLNRNTTYRRVSDFSPVCSAISLHASVMGIFALKTSRIRNSLSLSNVLVAFGGILLVSRCIWLNRKENSRGVI